MADRLTVYRFVCVCKRVCTHFKNQHLRYNLHTIKLIHFKCITQWVLTTLYIPSLWQQLICFLCYRFALLVFNINGIIQYTHFCIWLLPLSVMLLRFIRVLCVSSLFLYIAEQYSTVWICCKLLISSHQLMDI